MSKEVEWGQIFGEGDVVCACDNCGHTLRFPSGESRPGSLKWAGRLSRSAGRGGTSAPNTAATSTSRKTHRRNCHVQQK